MTEQKLDKLPKWAQQHIKELQRERDVAIRALNEFVDEQTPAAFFYDDMVCTGEERGPSTKVRYIQTHRISVVHEGVQLDVSIRDNDGITIRWSGPDFQSKDVIFQPQAWQSARLFLPKGRS